MKSDPQQDPAHSLGKKADRFFKLDVTANWTLSFGATPVIAAVTMVAFYHLPLAAFSFMKPRIGIPYANVEAAKQCLMLGVAILLVGAALKLIALWMQRDVIRDEKQQ